jgi:hypothetical protein
MQISLNSLTAVFTKLKSTFNTALANACPNYGSEAHPFTIDFPASVTSKPTVSFLFGKLTLSEIDDAGITKPTWFVLWTERVQDTNDEKMRDFAGNVIVGLDVYLYWKGGNVQTQNFEALSLATEDAVAECVQPYTMQNWGPGVVYDGTFVCQRGNLLKDDKGGFRQILSFRFGFGMYV